tara:strand:- start:96 stop:1232 length:1137 start_codon:yes stop_codon:yes gene_type:complete
MSKLHDADGRTEKLLQALWPDGMPERDRVIFEGLLPDRRAEVIARLDAVWRAENGEPLAPLAKGIGLKRAAFYNLRQAWQERSLEGIIPNARRKPRRMKIALDSPLRALARSLIIEDGMTSRNLDIARRLADDPLGIAEIFGRTEQIRLQSAERLVRHERRALSREPDYLRNNFSRRLVIDMTAVSILLEGNSQLAVVAVVLDAGSGLVLGSALNRLETAVEIERAAVEEARRFIARSQVDKTLGTGSACDLDIMLPTMATEPEDFGELREVTRKLDVRRPGTYGFGQELVQLIGPRMGRLPLAPRKTLSIDADPAALRRKVVELEPSQAGAYWDREVLRHNEPILNALAAANILGRGVPEGRMTAVLSAVDGLLLGS